MVYNPEGPKEQLLETWDFQILQDDLKTQEPLIVRLYGDESGVITNVVVKTNNGLKNYGTRRP